MSTFTQMETCLIFRDKKLIATLTAIDNSEMRTLLDEVLSIYLFKNEEGYEISFPKQFHNPNFRSRRTSRNWKFS